MKRILFVIFLLAGCASTSTVYGPDGEKYIRISCDGSAVPMSMCWDKAIDVCPQGYFLVGKEDKVGATTGFADSSFGYIGQTSQKSIYIRCKS